MEVEQFDDARRFRERVEALLLREEAANNLILGVTSNVIDYPERFEAFRGWVAVEEGNPVGAAAQTVPYQLILGPTESDEAIALLAHHIDQVPGVVGRMPDVETFVAERRERSRLTMSQGIFLLEVVTMPEAAPGISRPARADEASELAAMWLAFEEEAIGEIDDAERARQHVSRRIEEQSSRLGVWVHDIEGRIVSLSGHSGPTPHGIRIGPVYTPTELRGHGYASSLVARQTQWLLDSGHRYCFLYTDLANPTSNSIYQRIGYRQVAESKQFSFSPKT